MPSSQLFAARASTCIGSESTTAGNGAVLHDMLHDRRSRTSLSRTRRHVCHSCNSICQRASSRRRSSIRIMLGV